MHERVFMGQLMPIFAVLGSDPLDQINLSAHAAEATRTAQISGTGRVLLDLPCHSTCC
jgi:hypothetical protein